MEAPSPSYIISRAIILIGLFVAFLFGYGFVKKKQRQNAIFTGLQSIATDSSFFHQFYAEDARKSLVRAIGLIAEADTLGVDTPTAINRALGITPEFFKNDAEHDEPPSREKIIRSCLSSNYENFLKLGYAADPRTIESMKRGELPPIPSGPSSGSQPEIAYLINPEFSPGLEKVIANLEIRPPQTGNRKLTDIEVASAKQLAQELSEARIIEDKVRDRILAGLSKPQEPNNKWAADSDPPIAHGKTRPGV